jgi:hypothetical protein
VRLLPGIVAAAGLSACVHLAPQEAAALSLQCPVEDVTLTELTRRKHMGTFPMLIGKMLVPMPRYSLERRRYFGCGREVECIDGRCDGEPVPVGGL